MDAERVLDAAAALFAERGVDAVEMQDIARAAGCSRATLYRCFENRAALHGAFVQREARAVAARLIDHTSGIDDPRQRLLTGLSEALRAVRERPALAAWFSKTSAGAEAAGSSKAVQVLTAAFVRSLGSGSTEKADRQARWLVRVVASFLVSPGRDIDDERAMLEEFVLPLFFPAGQSVRR
ncbi:MAG: TetR/AcrR family transcriptional regulator [Mycobacterium sp.]|nr:MAG: TetR/AcrR family transcriptional regulator [Mycobacterium sp.]